MSCELCLDDPQPANFGTPRKCAFDNDGEFTPENCNCASICELLELHVLGEMFGTDETMQVVSVLCADDPSTTDGFLVFTRYKHRGRVSSVVVVHVGDFYPPHKVTLEMIEEQIKIRQELARS